MTTRRTFIRSAGLAAASALVAPALLATQRRRIGLQLYTLRDAMAQDVAGTLEKVARIGYTSVEGGGYTPDGRFYDLDIKALANLMRRTGLVMPSAHYSLGKDLDNGKPRLGTLLHGWEKAVDDAVALGLKYMVVGWLSDAERGSLVHYKWLADQFNKAGETCKKSGIQFCYHNHDFEFVQQEGNTPYQVLLTETDPGLVGMELDLYWVMKAGQDPVELIRRNPGRFPLWHVKDMDRSPEKGFTEVGSGVIDFKAIFAEAKAASLEFYFVEQDETKGSPFESIAQSYRYVRNEIRW